jgi:hypothetical protein
MLFCNCGWGLSVVFCPYLENALETTRLSFSFMLQFNKYSWGGCGYHLSAHGHRKGKALSVQVMVGVVILTKEIVVEQQPYKALSASATKTLQVYLQKLQ